MYTSSKERYALPNYERTAAILLVLLFLTASAFNIYRGPTEVPPLDLGTQIVDPYIEITITGAVKRPGTYQVSKGTSLMDAVNMAGPLENANLKKINKQLKITRRRKIDIKELYQK